MLFHLVLHNLSVTLLYSLEVLLRLLKLVFPIVNKYFGAFNFGLNLGHDRRNDVDLVDVEVLLVDAGSAE